MKKCLLAALPCFIQQVRPSGDYADLRYANPVCNLFNSEGLPAWPFRTDDWPGLTYGKL